MQADGHRTWGYVIYRTTYSSEDDWAEFLRRLRFRMERTFDRCNGRDILDSFTLTVFSDRSLFDGADTVSIRAHFRQWAETAFRAEQQQNVSLGGGGEQVRMGHSPRYRFCVQVDEAALYSVVHSAPAPPAPDATKMGWVKLIAKSWIPIGEDPRARARPDPTVYSYEPIEGVTERDVGWMKVPYGRLMEEYYSGNEGLNGWRTDCCRPPKVAGPPYSYKE